MIRGVQSPSDPCVRDRPFGSDSAGMGAQPKVHSPRVPVLIPALIALELGLALLHEGFGAFARVFGGLGDEHRHLGDVEMLVEGDVG